MSLEKSEHGSTTSPINRRKIRLNNMVFGKEVSFFSLILSFAQIAFDEHSVYSRFDIWITFEESVTAMSLTYRRKIRSMLPFERKIVFIFSFVYKNGHLCFVVLRHFDCLIQVWHVSDFTLKLQTASPLSYRIFFNRFWECDRKLTIFFSSMHKQA